jgi:putative ABC transport system permease protein
VLDPWIIALALFVSVATGVAFGVWPARRAAALSPIEALRYE